MSQQNGTNSANTEIFKKGESLEVEFKAMRARRAGQSSFSLKEAWENSIARAICLTVANGGRIVKEGFKTLRAESQGITGQQRDQACVLMNGAPDAKVAQIIPPRDSEDYGKFIHTVGAYRVDDTTTKPSQDFEPG